MAEKTNKNVRLIYGCVLSAMTAVVGILFIWQVLDTYFTGVVPGEKFIFVQADVYGRVARISPAFWLWVVMIAGGFIIWEVFPVKAKKIPYKNDCYTLMRLKKRVPEEVREEFKGSLDFIKREEKIINICWLCCLAVAAAGVIYTIVYLATPSHFTVSDNATHEVLLAVANIFPWAAAVFAVACGISVYEGISARKQMEHVKKLAAGNKPFAVQHGRVYGVLHGKYFKWGLRAFIGCLALAFIIAGTLNGNILGILDKAIAICSECIGLG